MDSFVRKIEKQSKKDLEKVKSIVVKKSDKKTDKKGKK